MRYGYKRMRRLLGLLLITACGGPSVTIAMVQQNNSGQDGSATLSQTGGGLEIEVRIKRSNIYGSQTSHVHFGRCDNVGPITAGLRAIGDAGQLELSNKANDPTFENDDLVFKTKLQETLTSLRDGNHVINVHDARENSLYVSCGEID